MALGSKLELAPGSWAEAVYEVSIGMIVGTCHIPNLIARWWFDKLSSTSSSTIRIAADGNRTDATDTATNNELKVVAVGYGRTGTVCRQCLCANSSCCCNGHHHLTHNRFSLSLSLLTTTKTPSNSIPSLSRWKNLAIPHSIRNIYTNIPRSYPCGPIPFFCRPFKPV